MINKDKYFDLLFKCLYDNGLLNVNKQYEWRFDLQKYYEKTEIDVTIMSKMKEQYGIGLQNVFLINCKKNALLCDNFRVSRNITLIQTAVYFTVLGCLLDHLLDYGNIEQQAEAKKKLKWNYCKSYILQKRTAMDDSVIDILYEKISYGMRIIAKNNKERFDYIVQLIELATDLERNVNYSNLRLLKKDVVINKSVIFVKIAVEILLSNKEIINDADRELINNLGYVFALIDDLCDIYEDMEIGQMNLLMEYKQEFETDYGAKKIINFIVLEIEKKLQILMKNFDRKLYEFILQEIKDWSMSNGEMRRRIWNCTNASSE